MKTSNCLTRVCLACAICAQTTNLAAQLYELHFTAFRKNKKIGTVVATQARITTGIQYHVKVDLNGSVIIPISVKANTQNYYDSRGIMQKASYRQQATGGFNKTTSTQWMPEGYRLTRDDKLIRYQSDPIIFTANRLYFEEPLAVTHVYSESHLCAIPIKKIATGVYQLKLPDGNETTYTYSGGLLQSVYATSAMGDVIFKRQNNSSYARQ